MLPKGCSTISRRRSRISGLAFSRSAMRSSASSFSRRETARTSFVQRGRSAQARQAFRLAHETGDSATQDRVVEALFSAYFTQGLDVGDHEVLADLAEGAGIERSRASAFLSEPASFDAVIDDEKLARGLGLNGVPSFVLGGNYLFSGAQPTSVMVRALREASAKLISAGQVAAPAEPAHAPA